MCRPLVAVVDPRALLIVRVPLLEKLSDEAGSMFFVVLNESASEKIDPPLLSIDPRCCVLLYAWKECNCLLDHHYAPCGRCPPHDR